MRERLRHIADGDQDGYLTYNEFKRMVEALPFNRKLLRFLVTGVIAGRPKESKRKIARHEYLKVAEEAPLIESYVENYSCCPPAIFILLLTIAEIVLFVYYYFDMQDKKINVTLLTGVPMYSPLIWDPHRRYEVWRYFSYIFLHSG